MKNKFRQGLSPRGEKENKGSTEETFGKGLAPGGGRKEGEEEEEGNRNTNKVPWGEKKLYNLVAIAE